MQIYIFEGNKLLSSEDTMARNNFKNKTRFAPPAKAKPIL